MKKILSVIGFCLFAVQANAAIIFQDDFGTGMNTKHSSNATFGNWTVISSNVETWNNSGFSGHSVDMNGQGRALGAIQTTDLFSFKAGSQYTLSFLLGNNYDSSYPNSDNGLLYGIKAGDNNLFSGTIEFLSVFLNGEKNKTVTLDFKPGQDVEASIFFTSTGPRDNGAAIIDNVKLVPEPSNIALLALGFLGLAARRFKK